MGDIADDMMDGTLCVTCRAYLGSDWMIPMYCDKFCLPKEQPEIFIQKEPTK